MRLTDAEVLALHRDHVRHSVIGKRAGCSPGHVWSIVKRASAAESSWRRKDDRPRPVRISLSGESPSAETVAESTRSRRTPWGIDARLDRAVERRGEWVPWQSRSDAKAIRKSIDRLGYEGIEVRTVAIGTKRRCVVSYLPTSEPPGVVKTRVRGSRRLVAGPPRSVSPLPSSLPIVDREPEPLRAAVSVLPTTAELAALIGRVVCPGCGYPVDGPGDTRKQALDRRRRREPFCAQVLQRHDLRRPMGVVLGRRRAG